MKAPERVFLLDVTEKGGALQNWNVSVTEGWRELGKVEYIRADLVAAKDAEIKRLREAQMGLTQSVDELLTAMTEDDFPDPLRTKYIANARWCIENHGYRIALPEQSVQGETVEEVERSIDSVERIFHCADAIGLMSEREEVQAQVCEIKSICERLLGDSTTKQGEV